MEKRVVVELDEDGVVVSVYCPDETYIVDLLDHADWNRDAGYGPSPLRGSSLSLGVGTHPVTIK